MCARHLPAIDLEHVDPCFTMLVLVFSCSHPPLHASIGKASAGPRTSWIQRISVTRVPLHRSYGNLLRRVHYRQPHPQPPMGSHCVALESIPFNIVSFVLCTEMARTMAGRRLTSFSYSLTLRIASS